MTSVSRRVAVVAVFAAAVTLTSCSAVPAGPLGFGGSAGEQCAPVADGDEILFGDILTAPAQFDVTVSSVELVGASGVSLDSVMVMPIIDDDAIGSSENPPPVLPAGWDQRVAAPGATVPAGTASNLLLVVTRSGAEPGKVTAVRVEYTVKDQAYSKTGTISYLLDDAC